MSLASLIRSTSFSLQCLGTLSWFVPPSLTPPLFPDFSVFVRFSFQSETLFDLTQQDRMMKELHDHGKTIEEIKQVLRRIPIHPRVIPAIKSAHALGYKSESNLLKFRFTIRFSFTIRFLRCELRIVSDANTFFIETVTEHLGISEFFSEINTNPGLVDEQGRLIISPYHDFTKSSHGCSRCPPNMCKVLLLLHLVF